MEKDYILGLYEKAVPAELTWTERLQAAKDGGFDYVEISIDETDERLARLDWSTAQLRELTAAMDATGVPIRSMCLSGIRRFPYGHEDPSVREKGLEVTRKSIDFSAELGIRYVMIPGYDVYYEEANDTTRANFPATLAKAVDYAAKQGVVLAFETMETPFMDTTEKAMKYVSMIDSPYLFVYPDLGNVTNAILEHGGSVREDIKTGRGHTIAAHVKETVKGAYREIPYGTGTTQYAEGLEPLWEMGVRRFVAEFWYKGAENWQEDVKFASEFVRGKIEAARDAVS